MCWTYRLRSFHTRHGSTIKTPSGAPERAYRAMLGDGIAEGITRSGGSRYWLSRGPSGPRCLNPCGDTLLTTLEPDGVIKTITTQYIDGGFVESHGREV